MHVASISLERLYPRYSDGDREKYLEMFSILKREGYDALISLEGRRAPEEDFTATTKEALDYLRACAAAV